MARHRLSERYGLPAAAPAAPVLPDLSRQNAVNARLAQFPLENEARQAQMDAANAREAQARYNLSKQIETDRQRTAFYNGLQELETNLGKQGMGIGTRGHAEAFAAYAHEFPLARSSADVQHALKVHSLVNDDQAALKARMNQLLPPPEKIAQRYAHVQGVIDQYQTAYQQDIKRQEAANAAAHKDVAQSNIPYNPNLDNESRQINSTLSGARTESQFLERSYPQLQTSDQTPITTPTPNPQAVQLAPGYGQPVAQPSQTPAPEANNVQPSPAPDQTPIYTPSPSPEATPDHSAAMDWANANPNDPRAQVIIQRAQAAMPQPASETTPQPYEEP